MTLSERIEALLLSGKSPYLLTRSESAALAKFIAAELKKAGMA